MGGGAAAGIALSPLLAACEVDSGGSNNSSQGSAGRVLASEAPSSPTATNSPSPSRCTCTAVEPRPSTTATPPTEHAFHSHLAPFQVIGRDGNDGAGRYSHGWKDTVNLDNGGRAELLIRFGGYCGKYVFHCHNLEHEDMAMMANFEVI